MRLTPGQLISLYVVIATFLPAVFVSISGGLRPLFNYFAADAFIYLSVAENSRFGFYTFDGVNVTNGFHPLWQVVLQAVFQTFGFTGAKEHQIVVAFWMSVTLVAAGSAFTAQAVLRWSGSMLAATLTVPGIFGITMLLSGWLTGTTWHFMNGMESPLSLFFFGLTVLYTSQPGAQPLVTETTVNHQRLLTLALLSTGIVFSRLDDIFLPAVIAAWILLKRQVPLENRIKAVLWFGMPLGSALLAYLTVNYVTMGHPMPVSAATKFGLQVVWSNLELLGMSLNMLVPNILCSTFGTCKSYIDISYVNSRNAQMLAPMVLAGALLLHISRARHGATKEFPTWMRLPLIYVVVKGLYNFLFVPLLHQGHWYFPVSITIANMACGIILARVWARTTVDKPIARSLGIPSAAVATILSMIVFLRVPSLTDAHYEVFKRGPAIAATLASRVAAPRIVEADDGIINYALGLPTMSGFLFAIDRKGYTAHKQGRFLSEASARGYQLIGSFYYLRSASPRDLTPEKIPDILRKHLFFARGWDMEKFDFALAYRDKKTGATFIRFTPKK